MRRERDELEYGRIGVRQKALTHGGEDGASCVCGVTS